MSDDTFPEGKPATDPMHELRLLRMAYRLLIATNQLGEAADLLIAQQVLHVLEHGTRHVPAALPPPEGPIPGTAGWYKAHPPFGGTFPDAFHEALGNYGIVPVPDYNTNYFPSDARDGERKSDPLDAGAPAANPTPEPEGFTIPERLAALGYLGPTLEAFDTHAVVVTRLVRAALAEMHTNEPIQKGGLDWYYLVHARWIDPIIHAHMAQVPGEGR